MTSDRQRELIERKKEVIKDYSTKMLKEQIKEMVPWMTAWKFREPETDFSIFDRYVIARQELIAERENDEAQNG